MRPRPVEDPLTAYIRINQYHDIATALDPSQLDQAEPRYESPQPARHDSDVTFWFSADKGTVVGDDLFHSFLEVRRDGKPIDVGSLRPPPTTSADVHEERRSLHQRAAPRGAGVQRPGDRQRARRVRGRRRDHAGRELSAPLHAERPSRPASPERSARRSSRAHSSSTPASR